MELTASGLANDVKGGPFSHRPWELAMEFITTRGASRILDVGVQGNPGWRPADNPDLFDFSVQL